MGVGIKGVHYSASLNNISYLFLICICFCAWNKPTFPQSVISPGIAQERMAGPSISLWPECSCVALFGSKAAPAASSQLSRHGVFPAEGKPRESGSQLPALSRQNHIRASPASLGPSREQSAPPQKGGEGRLGETRKLPLLSLAGENSASSATTGCGKIDVDPHGISQVSKMNPGQSSAAGPGWKGGEAALRKQAPSSPPPSLSCPFPDVIQLSVCLPPKVTSLLPSLRTRV